MLKDIAVLVLGLILLLGAGWAIQGNTFFMYQFFAPKIEQVRYDTFKQSQAYNEGMQQELASMQRDWATATLSQKDSLRSIILHRYAAYDDNSLPSHLRAFMNEVRRGAK
ncbi:MAG: hypothetical protein AB9917_02020 [Negativicutes bacterium]